MRLFIGFILFLLLSSLLQAYSKKIIVSSFSIEQKAQKSLESFKDSSQYIKLSNLAQEHSFEIYVRESGKYHIIVVEPILSKDVLNKAMKILKVKYKHAYANNYTPPEPEILIEPQTPTKSQEPVLEDEVQEQNSIQEINTTLKEDEILSHPIVQNSNSEIKAVQTPPQEKTPSAKSNTTQMQENSLSAPSNEAVAKKSEELDATAIFKWILFLVVLSTMTYYFVKFKRIYDEY